MKNLSSIILIISALTYSACNSTPEATNSIDDGLIEVSILQFTSEGMQLGIPEVKPFSEKVKFAATVKPAFNGNAFINIPMSGFVKNIFVKHGQRVNKGDLLFQISGNELIDVQREYSASSAMVKQLQANYERAQALSNENIGTSKDLLFAESAFNSERAHNKALKLKIEALNLDPVKIENGSFYEHFNVYASMKGTVSGVNATIGQFIDPQHTMAEIIDSEALQLVLSIFEKDINQLKIGQNVVYYLPETPNIKYDAVLSAIGKNIDPETRAIQCIADLTLNSSQNLYNNQYVQGYVVVNSKTSLAIPEIALLIYENEKYVLELNNKTASSYFFNKVKVVTGEGENGEVQILNDTKPDTIVLKGLYNIQLE